MFSLLRLSPRSLESAPVSGCRHFSKAVHRVPKRPAPAPLPLPSGVAPWLRPSHVDGRIKPEGTPAQLKAARRTEKNRGTAPYRVKPIQPVRLHHKFVTYEEKGRLASLQGAVLQYAQQLDGACVASAIRSLAVRTAQLPASKRATEGHDDRVVDTLMYAADVRLREKDFRPKFISIFLDGASKFGVDLKAHAPSGTPIADLVAAEIESRADKFQVGWASDALWGCLRQDIVLSKATLEAFLKSFEASRFQGASIFHTISAFENMMKMFERQGTSQEDARKLVPAGLEAAVSETISFRSNIKPEAVERFFNIFDFFGFKLDSKASAHLEARFEQLDLSEDHPIWTRLNKLQQKKN
mmetsp:Transcript_9138/g.17998  ORF Transcript_9138/g.17998 Transcript_9138/m.17998 type:complete len:355 (+) Transcript_9138:181-1245(+)